MKKKFKNYECELSGSLITIRENGELRKGYEVNPLEAISEFDRVTNEFRFEPLYCIISKLDKKMTSH